MKNESGLHSLFLPSIILLVSSFLLTGNMPVLAQPKGSVTSNVTVSDGTPAFGDVISVDIYIDMTEVDPPDDYLGSFTASLDWDPSILDYESNSGILAGFTGNVNLQDTAIGHIVFNGANTTGVTGKFLILSIDLEVVDGGTCLLNLKYSAMASAGTFKNLLPILTAFNEEIEATGPPPNPLGLDGAVSFNTLTSGSSISIAHTTGTGINRLMLVGVSWNSNTTAVTLSSVTFTPDGGGGDIVLSEVITEKHGSNNRYSAIYSLLDPPVGQPGTVTVNLSSSISNGIVAGVVNFAGVDQTTPLGTPVGSSSPSNNTTVTIDLAGLNGDELVFDNVFLGGSPPAALTVDPSQTELWNANISNTRGAASLEKAKAATVTMSWTAASSSMWVIAAVPINPVFTGTTYDLTMEASPGEGGTTDPAVGVHTYPEDEVVAITAICNVGYVFGSWTGDVAAPLSASTTVTMDGDKTVTANFKVQNYDLIMAVSPSEGGTTTPAEGGPYSYGAGEVVDITATAAGGFVFDSWTGDVADPSSATTTVTMDGNKTVTAIFEELIPNPISLEGVSSETGDDVNSLAFAHTTGTGVNRLLLVGVSWNCNQTDRTITSVTFTPDGGTAVNFTEVITQLGYDASHPRYSAIWGLVNPPSGQAGTVTVNFSGSVSNGIMAGAANFAGVDQTTPLGTPDGANGNSTEASVTLTGLDGDELVFDNAFLGASSTSYTLTAGTDQTELWNPAYIANLRAAASIEQATSSSVTMSWTISTGNYWAIAAVPINPATGGTTDQDLTFSEGWNIFSLAVIPENTDLKEIVQPLIDEGSLIKVQDETGNAIEYVIPVGWINEIGTWNYSEGYKLKVNANTGLTVAGTPVSLPADIGLVTGWNIMGYPALSSQDAGDAVSDLISGGYLIKVQDETGNAIEEIIPVGWIDEIEYFDPGEGYKIKVNADCILTINEPSGMLKSTSEPASAARQTSHFRTSWTGNGLDHMNVYITSAAINGIPLEYGDEIAVFDGDQCVGATLVTSYDHYISIAASKDDPETSEKDGYQAGNSINIRIWSAKLESELLIQNPAFAAGYPSSFEVMGTTVAAVQIVPGGLSVNAFCHTELGDNYPNPFKSETLIPFSIEQETEIDLAIYNLMGQRIKTLAIQVIKPGYYEIAWNRTDNRNRYLSPGIYICRMVAGNKVLNKVIEIY
jgi:uncharacterized repeat protein (TIGR02543 family)